MAQQMLCRSRLPELFQSPLEITAVNTAPSAQQERRNKTRKKSKLLYTMTSFSQPPSLLSLPLPTLNHRNHSKQLSNTHKWLPYLTIQYKTFSL